MPTFGNLARTRQQSFRTTSSTISEAGRNPTDPLGKRYGYLLTLGHEDQNLYPPLRTMDRARHFFSDRQIHWWKSSRAGDDTHVAGPTRNMASSQVACVNFLLPLATEPELLVSLLRTVDPDLTGIIPLEYTPPNSSTPVTSLVEFEWIGLQSSLEQSGYTRGANATSADALVVASTSNAGRRAYLIEWKYVEEYKSAIDKGAATSGKTRLDRYRPLYASPRSPFSGVVPLEELLYEPFLSADSLTAPSSEDGRSARVPASAPQRSLSCAPKGISPTEAR